MNQSTLGKLLFATCMLAATAAQLHGQGVHTTQLLSGGTSCLHVIRLIQIHGVNNSFDTAGTHLAAHPSPFGPYAVPETELGDLAIVQVTQEQHVDPACGPKFNITIQNNSCRDVCNFHVTLVATLGRIFPGSPHATVCVDKVAAGAIADVCVQLPVEALAMGNHNGAAIGFQKLVVAIDAYDELAETNEANNLKAFAAAEIPLATAAVVEETTRKVVTETESLESAAVPAPTASPAVPATPATPNVPAETDGGEETDGSDSLRSAIRMLDQPQQATDAAVATQ